MSLSRYSLLTGVLIFAVIGGGTYSLLTNSNESVRQSSAAADCTPNEILVNPCRPWLGAFADNYPGLTEYDLRSQIEEHESRIGRQLDIVHSYHAPKSNGPLSIPEKYFLERPNTILFSSWKPADYFTDAGGGNATVNQEIDRVADNIKAYAPQKIMLGIYLEPEPQVSGGATDCPSTVYKGVKGTPADYRQMWRNVRDRFDAKGVDNVVWVMNYMGFSNWNCMVDDLWPGNDLVDWVMWDPYSGNDNDTFNDVVSKLYNHLSATSDAQHDYLSKPWGLAEFGIGHGVTKTASQEATYQFYADAKYAVENNVFPKLKAYVNFDQQGVHDTQIAYVTKTHEYDPLEEQAYAEFANSTAFIDPVSTDDTTLPEVNITTPLANATVSGTIQISADVTDNVGIDRVEFKIDDQIVQTVSSSPYTINYDTNSVANGAHTLKVKAYDTSGNHRTKQRSINVDNPPVSSTPGDLNSDNKVDITDLSILLSDWGNSGVPSDINNDGIVDISDMSILLSNWN